MLNFAEQLASYGIHYSKNEKIEEQRIAVVLLDQSMEIMMKAFLIKKNYEVFYFKENTIRKGLQKSESFGKASTIDFSTALSLIKKELPSADIDTDGINHFHEIRNKVYHGAAVNLEENKSLAMDIYIPKLEKFYNSAFQERSFEANVILKVSNIGARIH